MSTTRSSLQGELAELNHDLGVSGTFFVQLRAQFYNPFERTELTGSGGCALSANRLRCTT